MQQSKTNLIPLDDRVPLINESWGRYPLQLPHTTPTGCNEHAKHFAVWGLLGVLTDLGIGSYESDKVIEFYWRNAPLWTRMSTQEEFNKYARQRISDFIGYTRRRGDAFSIVDKLFDKSRFAQLTVSEIIEAVRFLVKPEEMPEGIVVENGTATIVDLTRRSDSPKLLKVDSDFFPTLKLLYPWERIDDVVIKRLPCGATSSREFALHKMAWWFQHPETTYSEMQESVCFLNADRLDWTRTNLVSSFAGVQPLYVELTERMKAVI